MVRILKVLFSQQGTYLFPPSRVSVGYNIPSPKQNQNQNHKTLIETQSRKNKCVKGPVGQLCGLRGTVIKNQYSPCPG